MRTDPLSLGALSLCGIAWLVNAALLILSLLGRMPRVRKMSSRAYLIQLRAGLVVLTLVVLAQISALADWARPVRETINVLTFLTAFGALAALVKTATTWSETERARTPPGSGRPS